MFLTAGEPGATHPAKKRFHWVGGRGEGSWERAGENRFQKWLIQGLILNHPYIKLPNLWWFCVWKMKLPNLYHLMSLSVIKSNERSVIFTGTRLGTDFLL